MACSTKYEGAIKLCPSTPSKAGSSSYIILKSSKILVSAVNKLGWLEQFAAIWLDLLHLKQIIPDLPIAVEGWEEEGSVRLDSLWPVIGAGLGVTGIWEWDWLPTAEGCGWPGCDTAGNLRSP